jgi:hypothetical protein
VQAFDAYSATTYVQALRVAGKSQRTRPGLPAGHQALLLFTSPCLGTTSTVTERINIEVRSASSRHITSDLLACTELELFAALLVTLAISTRHRGIASSVRPFSKIFKRGAQTPIYVKRRLCLVFCSTSPNQRGSRRATTAVFSLSLRPNAGALA